MRSLKELYLEVLNQSLPANPDTILNNFEYRISNAKGFRPSYDGRSNVITLDASITSHISLTALIYALFDALDLPLNFFRIGDEQLQSICEQAQKYSDHSSNEVGNTIKFLLFGNLEKEFNKSKKSFGNDWKYLKLNNLVDFRAFHIKHLIKELIIPIFSTGDKRLINTIDQAGIPLMQLASKCHKKLSQIKQQAFTK